MIDLYCERLGPEFWAEPINAFTNLAFIIAAGASWHLAKKHGELSIESWVLVALMAAIGVGSFLFHTFANNLTRFLDVLPILLYQIAFLIFYARKIIKLSTGFIVGAVIIYLIAALGGRQFPGILNGALIYAPAFLLLLGLGIYHYQHVQALPSILLLATGVFCASLFFRTIDMAVCPYFPIGTHFLWHLLNGLLVYMTFMALLANLKVNAEARR
jgi:hypothetical protein